MVWIGVVFEHGYDLHPYIYVFLQESPGRDGQCGMAPLFRLLTNGKEEGGSETVSTWVI